MGLSSDAYNLLACRALEIVLQHWLVPSNNLRGLDCMIADLEKRRLPELQEQIVEGRLDRLYPPPKDQQHVDIEEAEEDTIERNNIRSDLKTKLMDEWRHFDMHEVNTLLAELSKRYPTEWLPSLQSNYVRIFFTVNIIFIYYLLSQIWIESCVLFI